MKRARERWLIFTFVPALLLLNAFVVLNYTGLAYQPFSWKAFAQSYPDGSSCTSPTECSSAFCENGVCCNSACPPPGRCDLPGRLGVCVVPAPAPALSGTGLLIGALLLAAVGTIGLIRNRRQSS
jgi:hypothetical protein